MTESLLYFVSSLWSVLCSV